MNFLLDSEFFHETGCNGQPVLYLQPGPEQIDISDTGVSSLFGPKMDVSYTSRFVKFIFKNWIYVSLKIFSFSLRFENRKSTTLLLTDRTYVYRKYIYINRERYVVNNIFINFFLKTLH